MAERSVLVRLRANIDDFKAQMREAERSTKGVGDKTEESSRKAETALGRLTQSARQNEQAWSTAGTALAGFGAVTVAGLGMAVKAAVDWESAWAGVTKTVSGTPQQLAEIETGLRNLARTMPATHDEIAAVAEAAGQLGVQTDSIVSFTRTMVDLGETTNLSADEAATSLAQMMNVMQTAPEDVGRLGAALVQLGNNGASTEAEIMNMAQRLAGAGRLVGASESDVLALANAMASMGVNAELGGGVMSRVLQKIYTATQEGGRSLADFADVAGMSAQDFATAFEQDPIRAVDAFIQGLNRVDESGGNVVGTLADLGMKGTEEMSVLLSLKGAGDLLAESLDTGSEAWRQNTALVEEAAKRYDTTASQLAIARNNINDAAIEIGETFLPVLADLAGGLSDVAGWFANLPDPIQEIVAGFAGLAGVGGLAAGAFLLIFPRVIETYRAFRELNTTMPGAAKGLETLGKAAGIAAVMAGLGTAVSSLDAALRPTALTMEESTEALLGLGGGLESLDARARELGQNTTTEINGFADAVLRVTDPGAMNRLNDFGGALFNVVTLGASDTGEGAASRRRTLEFLGGLDSSLALMVNSGNADMAAEKFGIMAAEAERNGVSIEELKELFPEYESALQGVANEQEIAAQSAAGLGGATAGIGPSVESTFGSLAGYAAALGLSEEATEDLIKTSQDLGTTLADFINPLGVYTGLLDEKKAAEEEAARKAAEAAGAGAESWRNFVTDTGFSFDEYMRRLEEQVTAQTNWQTNMLILAGRVSEGTLAELARMGPEGAPLVADLVNRSDAELNRFDEITALRSKEATDAWGAQLTMAAPVLAQIGRTAGQGVVDELAAKLAAGTTTVAEIARDYGISLAGGINPLLTGLGKPPIAGYNIAGRGGRVGGLLEAEGGVVDFYADGGVESHVAQIAPAGAWRVWAEPETGGEAYIPLSPAKRTRSVDIWRETGRRLGVDVQQFAAGGFSDESDVPKPYSTSPYSWPISPAAAAAMQAEYDAVTAWLRDNAEATGPIGSGAAGGSWQALWAKIHARFPTARKTSDYRPGDRGFHGRGKAVDVAGARPGDSAAMLAINRWAAATMGSNLAELIYTPGINLYRGRPHTYNAATRADHYDHVHLAAMEKGGILNPHVRDTGGPLLPGYTFNGTGGPEETVLTRDFVDATRSSAAPVPVVVKIEGARLTGTMDLGGGLEATIDGRIVEAFTLASDRGRYNG